jgi:S-DNA-T family DNA segregation ATPase FtsK/SpoIIIE
MWVNILKWIVYIVVLCLTGFVVVWLGRELFRVTLRLTPSRKNELLRIFLVLVAFFIGISIATFNPKDYTNLNLLSLNFAPNITNKCGIVGAIIGAWLYRGLGVASFIIPFIILLWGVLPKKYYNTLALQTLFLLGVGVFISFILAGLPITKISYSIIGDKLSTFGTKYFGIGKWLIASAFILSLLLSFEKVRNLIFRKTRKKDQNLKVTKEEKEKKEIEEPKTKEIKINVEKKKPVSTTSVSTFDVSEFKALFLNSLREPEPFFESESEDELSKHARVLEQKFEEFDISGKITKVAPGPVISRYEYEPAPGIKISRIAGLSDDIAMSMKSTNIRIVAPIPGKSVIGIEVPNPKRQFVYLKEILTTSAFESIESKLGVVLGKDIAGEPVCDDISGFPHLLVAGTTGSGKSVCINVMIASILYKATPSEVRFLMIDPKRLELRIYNGVPHLIRPAISEAKEALGALKEAISWMEIRYKEFAKVGVRDIEGYNQRAEKPKPYILIIIDELADLMMTAPRDIEAILTRLAQMSRAVGIHLILATQRPSVDIITGLIKANFPARIAFQVASKTDSRTILDMNGAEKLLGKGDMLFLPPGKGTPERLHGAYIDTQEAKKIADLWTERWINELLGDKIENANIIAKEIVKDELIEAIVEKETFPGAKERVNLFTKRLESEYGILGEELNALLWNLNYYLPLDEEKKFLEIEKKEKEALTISDEEVDELFEEAKALVIRHQTASVSLFQRHFKIGYARAGRLIDQLEQAGVIGPYIGSKSREVLIPRDEDLTS